MHGFHIAENFLEAIGYLMQTIGIDDIMVAAKSVSVEQQTGSYNGKDYYAMLHVHTTVHASLFTIHLEALSRWLINEEKYLEYMSMHAGLQCPSTPRCPVRKECKEDVCVC